MNGILDFKEYLMKMVLISFLLIQQLGKRFISKVNVALHHYQSLHVRLEHFVKLSLHLLVEVLARLCDIFLALLETVSLRLELPLDVAHKPGPSLIGVLTTHSHLDHHVLAGGHIFLIDDHLHGQVFQLDLGEGVVLYVRDLLVGVRD